MSPSEAALQIARQGESRSTDKLALIVTAIQSLPETLAIKTVTVTWERTYGENLPILRVETK